MMNLLLDTCALLSLASGTLSQSAREALSTADRAIVSPVVPWELAIKSKAGKLSLPERPLPYVQALAERHDLQFASRGLDTALLCAAADLPLIHRDPFDRVLVATALAQNLTLLTSDKKIPEYPGVKTAW